MRTWITLTWLAVTVPASCLLVTPAAATTYTEWSGGHGGNRQNNFCQSGERLAGLRIRYGARIDEMQALCVIPQPGGNWSGNPVVRGPTTHSRVAGGMAPPRWEDLRCPQNQFVRGFTVKQASYAWPAHLTTVLASVTLACSAVTAELQPTGVETNIEGGAAGIGTVEVQAWRYCPRSDPIANGVQIRSGSYVDAMRLRCAAPVATAPQAQLAAPQITAPAASQPGQPMAGVPRLRWNMVSGAQSYRVCIRPTTQQGCSIDAIRTQTTLQHFPLASYPALQGAQIEASVAACRHPNGTDCGETAARLYYVRGAAVTLSQPADGAMHTAPHRHPSFEWQPYSGFQTSAQIGVVSYTLQINSPRAAAIQYDVGTATQFQPPQPIPVEFGNAVTWSVIACNSVNCSRAGTRSLQLAEPVRSTVPQRR